MAIRRYRSSEETEVNFGWRRWSVFIVVMNLNLSLKEC